MERNNEEEDNKKRIVRNKQTKMNDRKEQKDKYIYLFNNIRTVFIYLHIKDFLSNLDCTATNERALRE
jgi:hypothetical protein